MDTVAVNAEHTEQTDPAPHDSHHPKGGFPKPVVIVSVFVAIAAVATAAIVLVNSMKTETVDTGIGYATEAHVMLDEDSLQAAMDKAMENARKGNVSLLYKDNAYSTDGTNFDCYIVNAATNKYDMYLGIYSDIEMTDELFLSQLVPPGSGFESITLEHSLDVGNYVVYVVVTQVDTDEETGEQTMVNQVVHTMDFHVQEG
jgi:hypothetical protein